MRLPPNREIISVPAANRLKYSYLQKSDYSYVMNYETTPLTARNLGNRLELHALQQHSYNEHALFDGTMYLASTISIMSLSKHMYKTSVDIGSSFSKTTNGRAVGELVIFHRPVNIPNTHGSDSTKPLIVYVPIYQSTYQNSASNTMQAIINLVGQNAPGFNESTPIYMPAHVKEFNLNHIIPLKDYVYYNTADAHHVVFPYQYGIPIHENTADILQNIVRPIGNPVEEETDLYWNTIPACIKSKCENQIQTQTAVRYRGPKAEDGTFNNPRITQLMLAENHPDELERQRAHIEGFTNGSFTDVLETIGTYLLWIGIGLVGSLALLVVLVVLYSIATDGTVESPIIIEALSYLKEQLGFDNTSNSGNRRVSTDNSASINRVRSPPTTTP